MSDRTMDAPQVSLPPCPGMITLRVDLSDAAAREAVAAALGVPVPDTRRIEIAGARAAAWMSPDELLVFAPREEVPGLPAALGEALAGVRHMVVDVSDARVLIRIEGPGAREVIAKGAPVDLRADAFGPGDFRRTRLGQVAVAFWMTGEAPDAFELVCFRSLAAHVEDWLRLAARPGTFPGVL